MSAAQSPGPGPGRAAALVAAPQAGWLATTLASWLALPGSARYRDGVAVWLGVFCAGFFVLPAEWPQRVWFYGGLPFTLPAAAQGARLLWATRLGRVIVAFLAYSSLSALWSENWLTVGDQSRKAACIGVFLAICCAVGQGGGARWRWVLHGVLLFCAAAAAPLAASFLLTCGDCERFSGYGRFANANYTASVTGAIGAITLSAVLSARERIRWGMLACQLPIIFLLLLTGSRAAMLAYLGSAVLAGALLAWRQRPERARRTWLAVLAVLAMAAAGVAWHGPDWIASALGRGDSLRLQIWSTNIERIAERPWFGHGSTTPDQFAIGELVMGYHAHNLFLAQAFYGGVPGLLLWLAVFGLAGRVAYVAWRDGGDILPPICLWFLLSVGMVDIGPVIVGIEAIWLYVWLLLGIVLAYDARRRAGLAANSA
jgi:O-antigen ligase